MISVKTRAIQKVKSVCACSPRACFVAADHWFLVLSVRLKSFLMQLYVGPCHLVAVARVVLIENPADCEVRGVIRFLQADEILGYLAEETSSRVELFCCTTMHVRILPGRQALLCEQFHRDIFEHPPYNQDLAPSDFFLFPKMNEHLAAIRSANEDLKSAVGGHMV